jgi:hypothetical protein
MSNQENRISDSAVREFAQIFRGSVNNYGVHEYAPVKKGQKRDGKSYTKKNTLLTEEVYKAHLWGQTGLGVIPIDEDSMCRFAVIDVDIYDADLSVYISAIERNKFPLVTFRSKSGGLHIYVFFEKPVEAQIAKNIMAHMAFLLSIDTLVKERQNRIVEIFPKQSMLTDGDTGTWINLPYFNAEKTLQYCEHKGKKLSLEEALYYIRSKTTNKKDVEHFIASMPLNDAPPCLQTAYILNTPRANTFRNEYLFNCGIYYKKKDESFFEQQLFEVNRKLEEPLDEKEIEKTMLISLRKKDYNYKCLYGQCRKTICKTREFGVGKEGGFFSSLQYGTLYQIATSDPYYEWEIKSEGMAEHKKLRFKNEDEIIQQNAFMRLCFRELHVLPARLKQSEWFKIVNQSLTELQVIDVEAEDDTSPRSIFMSIFHEFIMNRAMAATRDQILNKRVFYDEKRNEYYFRSKDLIEFLFTTKSFRHYSPTEIHGMLRDKGCLPTRIKTDSGKQLRVHAIHSDLIDDVAKAEAEQIDEFNPSFDTIEEKEF